MPQIYVFKQFLGVFSCGFYGLLHWNLKGCCHLLHRLPNIDWFVSPSAVGHWCQIGRIRLKQDLLHCGALSQGVRQLGILEGDYAIDPYLEVG